MNLNFEYLFQDHILDRGYNLVDMVSELKSHNGSITADVSGTHEYRVEIEVDQEEIIQMSCTCPYAADGSHCKHMAAVLYALDAEVVSEVKASMYDDLNKEQLIEFLEEQFKKDPDLYQAFIIRFQPKLINANDMKRKYDQILRHYLGREGFINYYKAPKFFKEMHAFLESIYDLKEQGLYQEVLELISYFTHDFDNIPLDDSDGGTTVLYDELIVLLNELMEDSDQETKDCLFDWMTHVIESPQAWYLREKLYPLWASQESDDKLLEKKISQIENRLSLKTAQPNDDYWFNKEVVTYGKLLLTRGDHFNHVIEVIGSHRKNSMVYKWLFEICEEKNLLELQLDFMNEALSYAKSSGKYGFINDIYAYQLTYYEKLADNENHLAVLKNLVLYNGSIEYWKKYKNKYSGDWEKEKLDLIKAFIEKRNWRSLYEIYAFEEMYDELMTLIEEMKDLHIAERHFEILYSKYPKKILELYLGYLDHMIQVANSRKKYQEWIKIYKRVKKQFEGKTIFESRLKHYKELYAKRKAFIDELNKARLI